MGASDQADGRDDRLTAHGERVRPAVPRRVGEFLNNVAILNE